MVDKADVANLVAQLEGECAMLSVQKPRGGRVIEDREELLVWEAAYGEKYKQLEMAQVLRV